jgi:major membrane immunogen (membrane-anchored lipoprotein)
MKKLIYISLAAMLLLTACNKEDANNGVVSEGLLTVPNVPGQWTYISLTEGRVVGSCELADSAAQHQWAHRSDWDLAICDGMIRTNGGDSGAGKGAIAVSPQSYEATDAAQPAAYATDRDSIEVW